VAEHHRSMSSGASGSPSRAPPGSCRRGWRWRAGCGAAGSPPAGRRRAWSPQTPGSGPVGWAVAVGVDGRWRWGAVLCSAGRRRCWCLKTRCGLNDMQQPPPHHAPPHQAPPHHHQAPPPPPSPPPHLHGVDAVQHRLLLLVRLHVLHVLRDEVRAGAHAPDGEEDVVVQEVGGEALDLLGEGRGEEHRLAVAGGGHVLALHDAADLLVCLGGGCGGCGWRVGVMGACMFGGC